MDNQTMSIAVAIDRIAELATESEDIKIIESSTAALKTLGILQTLGFERISIDEYENM
mgnify:CR=1 FL=1